MRGSALLGQFFTFQMPAAGNFYCPVFKAFKTDICYICNIYDKLGAGRSLCTEIYESYDSHVIRCEYFTLRLFLFAANHMFCEYCESMIRVIRKIVNRMIRVFANHA